MDNCRITALIASFFLLLPTTSYGFELGLGGSFSNFYYKEQCTPSDSESGTLPSYIVSAKAELTSSTFFEARYSKGKFISKYEGATLNTNIPVITTSPLIIYDYQAAIKQRIFDSTYIFAGYGYHNWDRQVGGSPGSPDEVYSWSYIPFGFEYAFSVQANQEMRVHIEAQQMTNSKMHGTFQGYSPVDVTLGSKLNYLFKFPIRWSPEAPFSVETTPWFAYSSIGESDVVAVPSGISSTGYLVEPSSYAYQYGLEVLFVLKF